MAHFSKQLSEAINQGVDQVKGMMAGDTQDQDIVTLILEDHKPLKELIAVMKDSEKSFVERKQAFMEFAPLLMTHAKSEEKALYEFMKSNPKLREMAFEGDTEHSLADQLCEEIKRTRDQDLMSAQIKVLAESVEHHITEEERDILPEVKKQAGADQLVSLSKTYNSVQAEIIADGQDDSPHESEITEAGTRH